MSEEYTLLKEAAQFLRQNKPLEAATIYKKIAGLFGQKNLYQKAATCYQKSFSLIKDPYLCLEMADLHEKNHRTYSAYECLSEALKEFMEKKDLEQALEIALRISKLTPSLLEAHERIAEIYLLLGCLPEASEEFQKASDKAFQSQNFKSSLKFLYYAFKLTPSNKTLWRKLKEILVKQTPQSPNLQKLRGLLAEGEGFSKEEKWKEELENARLFLEENLLQGAKKIYQKILSQDPSHLKAQEALEGIQKREAKYLGGDPLDPQKILNALEKDLGIIFHKEEKTKIHLETPLHELPPQTLYELAIAYKEMGLFSNAIETLKKVLKSLEKNPSQNTFVIKLNCTLLLGICYFENQQYFEAVSFLEKTLAQLTKEASSIPLDYRLSFWYYLGSAYELSENNDKALMYFRKIEKEDKRYRDVEDRVKKIRTKRQIE